jgi:hypothetical protein
VRLREVLSAALFGYDDVLGERVLDKYETESARRAPSAEKLRRETVASILAGEAVDVQRACSVLRTRSRSRTSRSSPGCVRLRTGSSPTTVCSPSRRSSRRARVVRHRCSRPRASRSPGRGWASARGPTTIAALLDARRADGISITAGEPAPGVACFRNGHAEALAAPRGSPSIAPAAYARWGSVAVLGLLSADVERAREFASRELGPLDADDDAMARLRATLAVYVRADDAIAATARRLGVHINTISYRLRRCEELLGRSNGGSRLKPRCCCAT